MVIHKKSHPLAGKTAKVATTNGNAEFRVEDYWDRVSGESWRTSAARNPAAMDYSVRRLRGGLPADDEVVYGKVGAFGHLVHVTELEVDR